MGSAAFLIALIFRLFIVWIVVRKAEAKNRSRVGWGLLAFFVPFIALLVIFFAGPYRAPGSDWDRNEEDIDLRLD
jgi:hypothetical protein